MNVRTTRTSFDSTMLHTRSTQRSQFRCRRTLDGGADRPPTPDPEFERQEAGATAQKAPPWTVAEVAAAVEELRPGLVRRCRSLGCSQAWAEDIVADAVERLLQKLIAGEALFSSAGALFRWLVAAAVFVAREQRRGRDALYHVREDACPRSACEARQAKEYHPGARTTPEDRVAGKELLSQLAHLSPSDQQLLLQEALGERDAAASNLHRRRVHLARERARLVLGDAKRSSYRRTRHPLARRAASGR